MAEKMLTIRLDEEIVKKLKLYAVEHDKSLKALITELVMELLKKES